MYNFVCKIICWCMYLLDIINLVICKYLYERAIKILDTITILLPMILHSVCYCHCHVTIIIDVYIIVILPFIISNIIIALLPS